MTLLEPIFVVAGIGVATFAIEKAMEYIGQGDKVMFIRVVAFGVTSYYALRTWLRYVQKIEAIFHVF